MSSQNLGFFRGLAILADSGQVAHPGRGHSESTSPAVLSMLIQRLEEENHSVKGAKGGAVLPNRRARRQ